MARQPYPAEAYLLVADDETREYGSEAAWATKSAEQAALGFNSISMKNEFARIYNDGVTRSK